MPWGWRGTWHQVVVGFDSLTRLWRASHQMHHHTPASIRSSIPLSHFLSSLHLEWTNSVFHSTPLRDRGPHIYSSRETQGGGWKNIKKFFLKMHETLLTFRTLNLVKASVRMKGQTEVRAGKKLHVLPTGPSRQKTTDADEKDALKVERWSLLQRKYVMNEMRWKKWIYFSPCKWWCNIHFYYILNNKKILHFQLFWKDCYLMCQTIWATCTITVLLKWWKLKRLQ